MRHLLAVVALLAFLAGCSSTAADDTGGSLAAQQQTTGAPLDGYSVTVAKLDLTAAPLVPLGLNADQTIQVPPLSRPLELGVYANGPKPGQTGPAVILGHINAGGQDGAFRHLDTLREGDEITTTAPGGGMTHFVVYRTQVIDKSAFPTASVYGDTTGPELRLISCGGQLDRTGHNYLGQIIIYARKV